MPRFCHFTPWKDPVPIVYEVGWTPRPVWWGTENLAPFGIRSSDRQARIQSLYRLSYSGPPNSVKLPINLFVECASILPGIPTWHLLQASQLPYRCANVNPVWLQHNQSLGRMICHAAVRRLYCDGPVRAVRRAAHRSPLTSTLSVANSTEL
jgi:hypothetical protein